MLSRLSQLRQSHPLLNQARVFHSSTSNMVKVSNAQTALEPRVDQ